MPNSRTRTASSQTDSLGNLILDSIRRVIDRTVQIGQRLPLPGEGDERPFRDWLKSQLLVTVLGWPDERVRIGERFDILLLDEFDRPVVTVETKAPYHRSSRQEQRTFRERLSLYGTLRTAYLTNGLEWDRLDLVSSEGRQTIREQVSFDISHADAELAESFFAPLRGDRYSEWGRRNRSLVAKAHPHILESLAKDLDSIVLDLGEFLTGLFDRFEHRSAGTLVRDLTRSIFDDWCRRSLQVSPQQVLSRIVPLLQDAQPNREILAGTLRELGFIPVHSHSAADGLLVLRADERLELEQIRRALMPLYHDQIKKLSAQSAHVLLARTLVYRIGEDMGLFDPLLGGEALQTALTAGKQSIAAEPTPALSLLESVRRRMLGILPVVYQLSDLDWWRVPEDKRAGMKPGERAFVESKEEELDRLVTRVLRIMDGYHFAHVDADVWRNVYQDYLPDEERQRIGGFYTPQELVEFILDSAGYVSDREGLCRKKVIDPACGSGAFVSAAAARLLRHLEMPLECHSERSGKLTPKWERQKAILQTVLSHIHAVDTHPFAAFLTTLNLTFLTLPAYAQVQKHDPTFPLDFRVFVADSLEKPDKESLAPDMFEQLNSRIQLTKASHDRFVDFIDTRFDLICGNPPWGGVLKGPLAPVFEERKKQRFKREFPNAATGKYDIYGLFMERAIQLLTDGGRFAMVTQDTYLDKEWARGLRQHLASNTTVQEIIDLNPFGQLFFKAMNTPAVTIFDKSVPDTGRFVAMTTSNVNLREVRPVNRKRHVLDTITKCREALTPRRRRVTMDFVVATRLPRQMLVDNSAKRWSLVSKDGFPSFKANWLSIADILEPRQGVTPGGCLDVFLMSDAEASALRLEAELVHRAIKTKETARWHLTWEGRVLLYPYTVKSGRALPAFAVEIESLRDSLDFDNALDDRERELRRGRVLDNNTAKDILEHRIALGLVRYPQTARYLVGFYTRLEGRVFKKRRMESFGRRWYEYLWPRDPSLMLAPNRIISPRLAREPRFSLDVEGFLADDSCQYLLPTSKTSKPREKLRQKLSNVLGREVRDIEVLCYCLSFMNSPCAQQSLVSGRRPTPKGSYQISEEYLKEIPVALPSTRDQAEEILSIAHELVSGTATGQRAVLETGLSKLVMALLARE